MDIFKKIVATLTAWRGGRENLPDQKQFISRAQEDLKREKELAREREEQQMERVREQKRQQMEGQGGHQEGVEEETVEIPEDDKAA